MQLLRGNPAAKPEVPVEPDLVTLPDMRCVGALRAFTTSIDPPFFKNSFTCFSVSARISDFDL
jgi:hypothetical protein